MTSPGIFSWLYSKTTSSSVSTQCMCLEGTNGWLLLLFSRYVVFVSMRPHRLLHAWLPCCSPSPGACSNSNALSQWYHVNISSCHPLLLPSIFPSIRFVSNQSLLPIRWLKYWSFSFSISPSNEYSGLISFRIDWLDVLAVQGTLKSFLQHHSSQASIFRHSAFFMIQLSHLYITTGKTIALTWLHKTFVEKCKYYNRHT